MIEIRNLRKLRINRNISLQDMAEALGLKTAGGYLRIETGEIKLKAEHLPTIAKKFGMSLGELISFLFTEKVDDCSKFDDKTKTSA